jgi:hypothetical protein
MSDAPNATIPLTASDLRAAIAHAGVRAYCVAARLRMHPSTLSLILNGHRYFDGKLASRILEAIKLEQGQVQRLYERSGRAGKSEQRSEVRCDSTSLEAIA